MPSITQNTFIRCLINTSEVYEYIFINKNFLKGYNSFASSDPISWSFQYFIFKGFIAPDIFKRKYKGRKYIKWIKNHNIHG